MYIFEFHDVCSSRFYDQQFEIENIHFGWIWIQIISWGALEKRTNKHQSDESSYNRMFCIGIWAQYYWAVNAEKWQNHWRIKSTHRNENAIYGFVFSYFLTIFFCCFCISSVCCVNSIQIQTHWDIFWMKMGKRMEKESKKSTGNTYE